MLFRKSQAASPVAVASPIVTEVIKVTIPPRTEIGVVVTPYPEISTLYTEFKALQHDAEWKITRVYDVDYVQHVGIMYFDIPSQRARDMLSFALNARNLQLKTIFI